MSDVDLSKNEQQAEPVQNEQKETNKKQSIRERVNNLPNTIDNAIEEGKGNSVIEGVQEIFQKFLTSTFESCQLASLRLFMLTPAQRKQMSGMLYILAIVIAALICVDLLFDFKIETILFALAFLASAYLADIIIQRATLQKKKQSKTKVKHNTDDDIL